MPPAGPAAQHLERRFPIDQFLINAGDDGAVDQRAAILRRDRTDLGCGRNDEGALGDFRRALGIEEGNQRLPHRQFHDRGFSIKFRIGAHRLRHRLHRFLVARSKGAQGVLHAVAKLGQNLIGDIQRILGNKVNTNPLGTDQPHHLLHLFQQGRRGFIEQQMRLIEEEHQLWLVAVTDFGEVLKQLRQHP